ncbi:hypothetical protein [Amphritea japonica]|uniref:hypothetical protein n=1 Tax=Amphritea japonica TaxID=452627 RepID=UPI000382B03E|nr:hypothetical protein [Amphritea japonica]
MLKFDENHHEHMYTISLAFTLILGITAIAGCFFAVRLDGIIFGVITVLLAISSGGVQEIVFNKIMRKANYLCVIIGGSAITLGLLFEVEGLFFLSALVLIAWLILCIAKFDEIINIKTIN